MAKAQKSQLVTKKHLARQQRERLQNRYILLISVAVIVIVVGLISYGVIQQYVLQPQKPVAKIGSVSITTKDFQTYVRYVRLQYIQQYQQYQQFAQLFGSDQASLSYIQQYLSQIEYQLEPTNVGQSALDYLIANELVKQEAAKRGITVSDAEITNTLENYFGYYANGTPTPTASSVPFPTSTLNPTQLVLVPPTVTPSSTATSTATSTTSVTEAPQTPTPTIATTPTAVLPTGTPLPTSTPYTFEGYQKDLATYMASIHTFAGLSEADYRWIFGMQLLRQKVMDALTISTPREQDQVWVRHIVSATQEAGQSIYQRLENGGDFMTIATEVMTSTTSTTIDLGWVGTGSLDTNVEKIVFNLQIGQYSEPIQTSAGWEVYQLLGHEVRELTETQYTTLKQTDFQNWIDQQKTTENVQTFDIWKALVPTSPTIPPTQTGQ
jgi:parvulin-like peptidyl-prolyl isomerase